MRPLFIGIAFVSMSALLTACSSIPRDQTLVKPRDEFKHSQVMGASQAVRLGNYDQAEAFLTPYLKRSLFGNMRFKFFVLAEPTRSVAVDTVVALLWETGRYVTLIEFSSHYLPKHQATVMKCRVAERQGDYYDAFMCWKGMGEDERAARVTRTEAMLRLLPATD